MFSNCMTRSSSGRPGASEPLRVAVCLLSDCFAVSEPMSETSAYRPLAPSETAKTATISQRCSHGGGGTRPSGGASPVPGDGAGPVRESAGPVCGPAGLVRESAGLVEMSSVIAFSITEPDEPNSPHEAELLSSVDQRGAPRDPPRYLHPSRGRYVRVPALSLDRPTRRAGPGRGPAFGTEGGQAHVRGSGRQHGQPDRLGDPPAVRHRGQQGHAQEGPSQPDRGPGQPGLQPGHRGGHRLRRGRRGAVAVDGAGQRPGEELGPDHLERVLRARDHQPVQRAERAVGARRDLRGGAVGGRPRRDHPALAQGVERLHQASAVRVNRPPVVLAAVPTLFDADGELDRDANRALYKLISGLLDGMLVAGTTGEFPALEDAERLWLAEQALAEAGPDRVIVHIGAPDARHAARLARAAVALGARRIAAITPYYLPARPDELVTYYRSVREAAPGAEIYAYIFPERTGLTVSPTLLAEAAQAASLAGAKISGSASADLAGYVAAAAGLRIFSGNDADPWATARAGAEGVISGRSSAYPELYAALVKDPAVQERLDRVVALGASVGRLKHALRARGLAGAGARMTVDPPDPQLAAAIEAEAAALAPLLAQLPVLYLPGRQPAAGVARRSV